ncbi:DUF6225 family protein [Nonomuraea sp. NPDC005650]|uniref:DUF6225 family protein n=1 Tax=Nonomuraea sp. NPDC005650 TaxID=3157045 RepID=UPI0033B0D2AC
MADTVFCAFMYEFGIRGQRPELGAPEPSFYGILPGVARLLDWLIRHYPRTAMSTIGEIVGEAERGSHGDLAAAMDVARSTAQSRGKALSGREPSEQERWASGPGPSVLPAAQDDDRDDDQVPRTGVVPWETVTSPKGERAWTAGQLREALAGLPDDAPVIVHVASESDLQTVDDQIITSAGYGNVAWGERVRHGARPDLRP